jgi:hypothetical protein
MAAHADRLNPAGQWVDAVESCPRAPVAQWIEQPPPKGQVARSIRVRGAIQMLRAQSFKSEALSCDLQHARFSGSHRIAKTFRSLAIRGRRLHGHLCCCGLQQRAQAKAAVTRFPTIAGRDDYRARLKSRQRRRGVAITLRPTAHVRTSLSPDNSLTIIRTRVQLRLASSR